MGTRTTDHTARKRLRKKLEEEGLSPEEIELQIAQKRQQQTELRTFLNEKSFTNETIRGKIRVKLAKRDGRLCWLCNKAFTLEDPATIDHVIPQCQGGSDGLYNLRLAHYSCNHDRGYTQDPGIDGRTGTPHKPKETIDLHI